MPAQLGAFSRSIAEPRGTRVRRGHPHNDTTLVVEAPHGEHRLSDCGVELPKGAMGLAENLRGERLQALDWTVDDLASYRKGAKAQEKLAMK